MHRLISYINIVSATVINYVYIAISHTVLDISLGVLVRLYKPNTQSYIPGKQVSIQCMLSPMYIHCQVYSMLMQATTVINIVN